MTAIEFQISFEPSPALAELASLYERYFRTATTVPFDKEDCESAYFGWKAAMEAVFPDDVVVPGTVAYSPPRPPGVTDEDIAEVGDALARGYWPVHG
jgi:hypothetical protein